MKSILVLLVIISTNSIRGDNTFENIMNKEWFSWKTQMNKIYSSIEEEQYRFGIWLNNYEIIQNHNKQNHSYTFGLNKFSDLTFSEFRIRLGFLPRDIPKDICKKIQIDTNQKLQKSIDWRRKGVVTPIKDQGDCGSCWAFSATGSLESAWALFGNHSLFNLSEQQLVDCSAPEGNYGCGGGLMDFAFNYTIQDNGLCTDESYPYSAMGGECVAHKCKHVVTITKCIDLWTGNASTTEEAMQITLAQQPISVGVYAGNPFWMNYKGGIIDNDECGNQDDHGVVIVGYDTTSDGQDYWIVKNSWGTSWGLDGYVYIAKGKNMCGIGEFPSYPVI